MNFEFDSVDVDDQKRKQNKSSIRIEKQQQQQHYTSWVLEGTKMKKEKQKQNKTKNSKANSNDPGTREYYNEDDNQTPYAKRLVFSIHTNIDPFHFELDSRSCPFLHALFTRFCRCCVR